MHFLRLSIQSFLSSGGVRQSNDLSRNSVEAVNRQLSVNEGNMMDIS
ncbi:hypothetical protein V461_00430 [Pantoea ananatis BRT98]|nr:hypothetical protein V461_00430 [Pantoea ananatis BRT98]CRH35551.1 hypothetical protein BN1183_CH_00660 [Pantoea ananatis]